MRIEHTSDFRDVIDAAERHNARSVSIQSYYSFCNFNGEQDATGFHQDITGQGFSTLGINTQRPGVPFEVAVYHKCCRKQ